MAQSAKQLTSAQVMISELVSSSIASSSVLITQSLEPASDSVSHSLSAPLTTPTHALSLSVSKIIKTCKKIKKKRLCQPSGTTGLQTGMPDGCYPALNGEKLVLRC